MKNSAALSLGLVVNLQMTSGRESLLDSQKIVQRAFRGEAWKPIADNRIGEAVVLYFYAEVHFRKSRGINRNLNWIVVCDLVKAKSWKWTMTVALHRA